MKREKIISIIVALFIFTSFLYSQEAPKWAVNLGEPIKTSEFMQDGKLIFFTSGEYAWCYNVVSGTEVWSMEVPDFDEDGISYLLGEMYLTKQTSSLRCNYW